MICAAPGCTAEAVTVFTAAANGRLGGQDWRFGDPIRLCAPHAHDVYMTQGVDDPAKVAEWLRPDAADPPNYWRGLTS